MDRINLLIVDDHPLLRAGIKALLFTESAYSITEAEGGEEAIQHLQENRYDIVLLDIDMPGKNGIEVAQFTEENYPETKIVFLTSHADFYTFAEAIEVKYSGFLFKENALELLKECLATVLRGEKYLSKGCSDFIQSNREKLETTKHFRKAIKQLTETERRIILLISEGKTTPQIAELLFNSGKTIENHRTNICQKLELKGSNNLLTFALENKWLLKTVTDKKE